MDKGFNRVPLTSIYGCQYDTFRTVNPQVPGSSPGRGAKSYSKLSISYTLTFTEESTVCNYLRHKIAQKYPYVPAPDASPLLGALAATSWLWGGPGGLPAILGHISSHTLH